MAERPRSTPSSLSNLILFFLLSAAILLGHKLIVAHFLPPAPVARNDEGKKTEAAKSAQAKAQPKEAKTAKTAGKPEAEKPKAEVENPKPGAKPAAPLQVARQWVTLGSADENDPYRMLVTLSNQGAALARIELSSDRYRDLRDLSGYLGHVVMEDDGKVGGAPVQAVGEGTPAAKAGLKPGDRITAVDEREVRDAKGLDEAMTPTQPGQTVTLTVLRDGKARKVDVELIRRPLEVVRPERAKPEPFSTDPRPFDAIHPGNNSPLSILGTIEQVDDEKIPDDEDPLKPDLDQELKGVDLRRANWDIVKKETNQDQAVFRRTLPDRGLEITKTYRMTPIPQAELSNSTYRAYHLEVILQVKNLDGKAHLIAYRLDGPNGLPDEGAWYASKVSHESWGGAGMRDVLAKRAHTNVFERTTAQISDDAMLKDGKLKFDKESEWPFDYLDVDAQYFTVAMLPNADTAPEIGQAAALRAGEVDPQHKNLTNTSFRLVSKPRELKPGELFEDRYELYAGPKEPNLLAEYALGDVITYGWFGLVARPMTQTLHFFYYIVRNYGVAIILLTVLVRLCMFPLSRKQALGAQKMQELQPEIKSIQEKFKKDPEARMKAQQELFRKNNYNPLGGCLVLFIQLPIFIGLYRSLQVDVALRGAPLISHAVRWCSNLAAPDMLFDWSPFMPQFVLGWLGPYFNLLPLLTIGLFIAQQKMFMPPPADEQAAMQQKMMNFMMVFMGVLFFKVAAGLCIYFIASSLWGMAERKFLPKTAKASAEGGGSGGTSRFARLPRSPNRDGAPSRKKKNRKK
jgi:YidC/Oxa1 family membrane protein insertase